MIVSWDTIEDMQARYLHRRFDKPKLSKLKRIAIDEIHLGTGSGYLTTVMDLDSGALVEVADGKSTEILAPFWKRSGKTSRKLSWFSIISTLSSFTTKTRLIRVLRSQGKRMFWRKRSLRELAGSR